MTPRRFGMREALERVELHGDLFEPVLAGGQALALELEGGSISVSAVGALAGAAIAGPKAALPLAVATAAASRASTRALLVAMLGSLPPVAGRLPMVSVDNAVVAAWSLAVARPV